jgi:ABC-type spermidine/putrescine transport system permease subunit II
MPGVKDLTFRWFTYILLCAGLVVYSIPILEILYEFLRNIFSQGGSLSEFFSDPKYKEATGHSLTLAIPTALFSTIIGYYFAWCIYTSRNIALIVLMLLLLLLIPTDIQALSLLYIGKYVFDIKQSSLWLLFYSHLVTALPISTLLIYLSLINLDTKILETCNDLGCSFNKTLRKVILPLTIGGIGSSMIFGFLISMNEYQKSKYLQGNFELISSIIVSKMKSGFLGTELQLYALIVINIVLAAVLIIFLNKGVRMIDKK